jgi:hypothetical protein
MTAHGIAREAVEAERGGNLDGFLGYMAEKDKVDAAAKKHDEEEKTKRMRYGIALVAIVVVGFVVLGGGAAYFSFAGFSFGGSADTQEVKP